MKASDLWAVVPAAGLGRRFAGDRPKQYAALGGRPVIAHVVAKLAAVRGLAGIVAADIPGGDALIGRVEEETDLIMRTIRQILADHDVGMGDLVRVDVHLLDLDEIHVMDRAYRRYLDPNAMPARTTTQSVKLYGGSRVEITCMARRR